MTKEDMKEKIKGLSIEDRENLLEALDVKNDAELIAEINRLQSELASKDTKKVEEVKEEKKKKSFFDELFGG